MLDKAPKLSSVGSEIKLLLTHSAGHGLILKKAAAVFGSANWRVYQQLTAGYKVKPNRCNRPHQRGCIDERVACGDAAAGKLARHCGKRQSTTKGLCYFYNKKLSIIL